MGITSYSEDILPELQTSLPVSVAAQAPLDTHDCEAATPGIVRDISGCLSLFGPVEICWSVNLGIPSASISLKVFGVVVVSGEISPQHPCLTLKGDYKIAKWDLNICLRLAQKAITLEGKVCVSFAGCKSFNITLFHWGALEDLDELAGGGYPAYQCFKTQDRQVYCSSYKVKSHAEGNVWIKACTTHFGVQVFGRPYLASSIPAGAITYPS